MMSRNLSLDQRRYHVLIASCLINLCIGSMYAWSVFALPLAARLSDLSGKTMDASTLSLVFTVANAVGPITMIAGGAINDRLGPKWVVFIGGLMFGAGMLLSSLSQSLLALVLSYGILLGFGVGLVYGCTIGNTIKFFPDKSGLAGGLTAASYGLSSVLVPPVANALVQGLGVSSALQILGVFFMLVICGGAFFMQKCPADYLPSNARFQPRATPVPEGRSTRQMLQSPAFYVMISMLICGAFSGLMLVSQASPIAQKMIGMSNSAAAIIVSVLALFNAGGRILSGFISDRLGRVKTLGLVFILCLLGCLALYFSSPESAWLFVLGICVVGVCFGSLMGIFPSFTLERFGKKHSSVNYGVMFIGFALAGILGPQTASAIFGATAQYRLAFLASGLFAILGFALCKFFEKRYEGTIEA